LQAEEVADLESVANQNQKKKKKIQKSSSMVSNTDLQDISPEDLVELAETNLHADRLVLRNRTKEDKTSAVREYLKTRSCYQWLPTCCICHEKRISDGLNIKEETSIPRSGHIKAKYPGQNVCSRFKDEKVNVKAKGACAVHKYSIDANMYPGDTPLVLARLSKAEVLCISRIHMLSQMVQICYGVYGYRACSVFLPNDVLHISNEMPRRLDDLSHFWLRLLFPETTFLHHDYRVRREYVREALHFLINEWDVIPDCRPSSCTMTRNPAYSDLEIIHLSQENFLSYPEDGVPTVFLQPISQEEQDPVDSLLAKEVRKKSNVLTC